MKRVHEPQYGDGSITPIRTRHGKVKYRARIPDTKGGQIDVGTYWDRDEAARMKAAALEARDQRGVGTTWRQWGDAWLKSIQHHKSHRSAVVAWNVVMRAAPFADDPMADHDPVEIVEWFEEKLPTVRKQRSIKRTGKRVAVDLKESISFKHANNVLGYSKRCCERAKKKGLISANPIETASIQRMDRDAIDEGVISFLPAHEIENVLSCQLCAVERGIIASDIVALVDCPHMPFEQRVVFTVQIHQCPRQGELAGMNWERCDFRERGWTIAQSWNGSTKNGRTRWQAWVPRAERAIRAWWEFKGRPTQGIMFPSSRGPKRPVSGKSAFVAQLPPGLSSTEVVARARKQRIKLTVHHVEVIRSRLRAREARARNETRYAVGYDWGWADHPEKKFYRLGWARRCGVKTRTRFHDFRDTAATHLLSGTWGPKWPIKLVSDFLGHSSVKVTEDRYAHLTKESKQLAAQAVESDPTWTLHAENRALKHVRNMSSECEPSSRKSLKSLAPEVGLEPTTRRLTAFDLLSEVQDLRARGQIADTRSTKSVECATSLLATVAAGKRVRHSDLCELAEMVLADARYRLATQVLEGGRHTVARGKELARLVLEGVDAQATVGARRPTAAGRR